MEERGRKTSYRPSQEARVTKTQATSETESEAKSQRDVDAERRSATPECGGRQPVGNDKNSYRGIIGKDRTGSIAWAWRNVARRVTKKIFRNFSWILGTSTEQETTTRTDYDATAE